LINDLANTVLLFLKHFTTLLKLFLGFLSLPEAIFEDHDAVMIDLVLGVRTPSFIEKFVILKVIASNDKNHDSVGISTRCSKPLNASSCQIVGYMGQGFEFFTSE
jgi:hypothetical protein